MQSASVFTFLPRPKGAFGIAVAAGALVVWLSLTSAAPAADTDLTPSALQARKAVGLPSIASNSAVRAAAVALLAGGDPQAAFASQGGSGKLIIATAPAGGALSTAKLKVVIFDPRLTAIVVLGRGDTVAAAAALDPGRPFPGPVLAGATFDPGVAGSLAVLFPPAAGTIPQISLQRYRGSQLVTIEITGTATPGAEGAVLVQLRGRDRITGPQVGYGLTYTLSVGSRSYRVSTRSLPPALARRSFVAGEGFAGSDRAVFLRTVGSFPPLGQKIVDTIAGAITVHVLANSAPICGLQTSCAGFDPGKGYFMILNRAQLRSSLGRFAISHELGHLVDFLGLDSFSYTDLKGLFTRSSNWKSCFPLNGSCTPFLEVFADQFGFYSTNAKGIQSGYNDDRLATTSGFANVLEDQWAFRPPQDRNPLAGFGPLSKSFEDALHSSAQAL